MANTLPIVHKRTSVSGRLPEVANTLDPKYIRRGELSINLTDQKVHTSNGTAVFEVGANLSTLSVQSISANGSLGTNGYHLMSNGTGVYWSDDRGYTGSQGDIGYTGSRGFTGFVGSQGDLGFTGSFGFTGSQGEIGYTGSKGETGSFGGASFDYNFSSNTLAIDPGTANLSFNNTDLTLATTFYIHQDDINNSNTYNYLDTIDDSTSAIKGTFKVIETANILNSADFSIIGYHAHGPDYFTIPVAWLNGATSFVDNTSVTVTFVKTGDKGDTGFTGSRGVDGYTGSQGSTGFTGSAGVTGFTGSAGTNGFTGSTGFTGSAGTNGFTGSVGATGFTGSIGFTGSAGTTGFTGSIGSTGFTGSIGSTGFTGSIGFTGSAGTNGFTGSAGVTGFTGSAGTDGFTGSAGTNGFTGSAGFTGSQGVIGYTGSTGPLTIQTISSNTIASTSVDVYQSNAQLTLTLPDPSLNIGSKFQIKNINNQEVTVVSANGNIDGYSNMILKYKNSAIFVVATPTNWIIL